jgi:hypothetical protein
MILHGRLLFLFTFAGEQTLTLAGLCLWTPAAPCLALTLLGEVLDLIGVNVEHDLASACIVILNHYLRALAICNFGATEVGNQHCLACHDYSFS